MRLVLFFALITLISCAPRGELAFAPQPEVPVRTIYVGSTRGMDPRTETDFGYERRETLELARFDVTVPPDHTPGELSYPIGKKRPDPRKDFLVADEKLYAQDTAFRADLRRQLARSGGEAIVFIHGFNTNFAEGLYRLAQLGTDFDIPGTLVYYAWPSRGNVLAYAYDRDSALFARDGLQDLLRELRLAGARKILLVAHSMGSALSMETLRQIAISADSETLSRISGVVLISPDIDVDVFRAQAKRIGTLPQPFVIFTSQRDKALRLASRISGDEARLGSLQDVSRVADLKVTMIDVGAFSVRDGHFNLGNSPSLIKLLGPTGRIAKLLEGEQSGRTGLASGVILTVQNATQIILSPAEALGG